MSDQQQLGLDFEKLLAPISEQSPSGDSLRYEGTYDRIREARRRDDPNLEQGIWQRELKAADWPQAGELCSKALSERTKDMQVAVWLLEALLHTEGFRGVAFGLHLLLGLCERFWDTIHPQPDNGDLEARVSTIEWIDQKLAVEVKRLPITNPTTRDSPRLSWADWEAGMLLEQVAQKNPRVLSRAQAEGKVTQARFKSSATLTHRSHFEEILTDVEESLGVAGALNNFLDEKCGKMAPSLGQFRGALTSVRDLVSEIVRDRGDEGVGPLAVVDGDETEELAHTFEDAVITGGAIKSRAQAYRMLSEAAEYLLRTEPHSPTPYLVKRAVAWGSMPLEAVLNEIVRNDEERSEVFRLLRIGRFES